MKKILLALLFPALGSAQSVVQLCGYSTSMVDTIDLQVEITDTEICIPSLGIELCNLKSVTTIDEGTTITSWTNGNPTFRAWCSRRPDQMKFGMDLEGCKIVIND
jgi:hypothetical protein